MKRYFILAHEQARQNAVKAVQDAPEGHTVTIAEPTRNHEQNAAMWPILEAFSKQLKWPVSGQLVYMSPEDWKDLLSAAFERETVRVAMGLEGGMVMLGLRTSHMSRRRFSEWLDFLNATAALRGVELHYREAVC